MKEQLTSMMSPREYRSASKMSAKLNTTGMSIPAPKEDSAAASQSRKEKKSQATDMIHQLQKQLMKEKVEGQALQSQLQ